MDELGSFETLAQIALGIAGFSGVVVAFSDRPAGYERADSVRILSLLSVSVGALLLSLLPSGLALAQMPRASIWRVGSAVAVVASLAWAVIFPRRVARLPPAAQLPRPAVAAVLVIGISSLCAQALNAAGFFTRTAAAVYYFGIVWLLLFCAMVFANVVFRRPER